MEVTEVRVFLRNKENNKKLKAYVTVTFDDCFVVRDVKVIEGSKGLFVAMPSAKMKTNCPKCAYRNVIRSKYCNQCGAVIEQMVRSSMPPEDSRQNEHKDIAHPITPECREYIQRKVLDAYKESIDSTPASGSSVRDDIAAMGDLEEDTEI